MSGPSTPHAHDIHVEDRSDHWSINYGDRFNNVQKPSRRILSTWQRLFRQEPELSDRQALEEGIKWIILRHDEESKRVGESVQFLLGVIPQLNEHRWGSDQLRSGEE